MEREQRRGCHPYKDNVFVSITMNLSLRRQRTGGRVDGLKVPLGLKSTEEGVLKTKDNVFRKMRPEIKILE